MDTISGVISNLSREKQAQMRLTAGTNDDLPRKIKASIDINSVATSMTSKKRARM
ncbi:predicted protein [Botrytis cinerea T4]|uniref:Uncharacterized protein n=1 Tax=Botryotinia fuckeliana (strain T4) TaxID=999810 RepID=G2Y2P4_BOTF4|nr:predicted protein [Botrytis cinerea T4]